MPASELPERIRKKYPHGVPFTAQGFPIFTRYRVGYAKIALTGDRFKDEKLANEWVGYSETPKGFTWRHHHVPGVMELVPTDLHEKVRHHGGAATSGLNCRR